MKPILYDGWPLVYGDDGPAAIHLLTLLQPGIFRTQKEFRAAYMTPGKPRVPVNQERLRDLMRRVMIRNTRAVVALRLPRRHATTHRVEGGPAVRHRLAPVRPQHTVGSYIVVVPRCQRTHQASKPLPVLRVVGGAVAEAP